MPKTWLKDNVMYTGAYDPDVHLHSVVVKLASHKVKEKNFKTLAL